MKPLITDEQARERFEEMTKHFGKAHRVLVPTTNSLLNLIGLQLDLILYLMQQIERLKPRECITAQYGATCFDVLQDAQNDIADPNGVRYDPEFREAVLRGEKMCDFCRSQRNEKEIA